MKGLFVPIDVNFPIDPKVVRVSAAAKLTYLQSLMLAKQLLTDGRLEAKHLYHALDPEHVPQAAEIAAELVAAGLWEECEDGWMIPAWLKHNKPAREVEHDAASKRQAGQHGGRASAATRKQTPSRPEALCLPSASASAADSAKQTPTQSTETEVETETEPHSLRSCSSECVREDLPVESPCLDGLGIEPIPNALPEQPDFDLEQCLEPYRRAQAKRRRPVNELIVHLVARLLHTNPEVAQALGHQGTAQEVGAILADWVETGRPVQVQSLIPNGPNSRAPSGDPWWAVRLQRSLDPPRNNGHAVEATASTYPELR